MESRLEVIEGPTRERIIRSVNERGGISLLLFVQPCVIPEGLRHVFSQHSKHMELKVCLQVVTPLEELESSEVVFMKYETQNPDPLQVFVEYCPGKDGESGSGLVVVYHTEESQIAHLSR